MNHRVLHIMPDSARDPSQLYLGSTKDIRCRTEYFQARGIPFDEISVKDRSDTYLLSKLKSLDMSQYNLAILEIPFYPKSLRYLHRQCRNMQIWVRPATAEFYHQTHMLLARGQQLSIADMLPGVRRCLGDIRRMFVRLRLDYISARRSDHVLSISEWETQHYWRCLAGDSKVNTVPYFVPQDHLPRSHGSKEKKDQCVCLMSSKVNPLLADAARNFLRLVDRLGQRCPQWSFCITGDISEGRLKIPRRVMPTGFLATPDSILGESRAMVVLSDYGFGFKTKILDAVENQCYVLMPSKLYGRLPKGMHSYCKVVDLSSVDSFAKALESCSDPFPAGSANEVMRSQAFDILDSLIATIS